jgi:uncharacterized protein YecE (DUF72 family)
MDFGKTDKLDDINFSFPEELKANLERLHSLEKKSDKPSVYLGGTAWTMKEWKGTVYPAKIKATEYLEYYSKQFGTIEFNTTHYRIPNIDQVIKWKDKSADDFRFCPKIPQIISHRRLSNHSVELMNTFTDIMLHLEHKIGCSFIQLPPHFGPNKWEDLKNFLQDVKSPMPLSIEFRNAAWFENNYDFESKMNWLHSNGFHPCITDVAGRRDVLHQQLAGDKLCVRFVGCNDSKIDHKRLDEWAAKLKFWLSKGLNDVYFFLHHPNNIKAAQQSLYLHNKLTEFIPGVQCKGPNLNLGIQPQMKLF